MGRQRPATREGAGPDAWILRGGLPTRKPSATRRRHRLQRATGCPRHPAASAGRGGSEVFVQVGCCADPVATTRAPQLRRLGGGPRRSRVRPCSAGSAARRPGRASRASCRCSRACASQCRTRACCCRPRPCSRTTPTRRCAGAALRAAARARSSGTPSACWRATTRCWPAPRGRHPGDRGGTRNTGRPHCALRNPPHPL